MQKRPFEARAHNTTYNFDSIHCANIPTHSQQYPCELGQPTLKHATSTFAVV